jgi:hypothetical protein
MHDGSLATLGDVVDCYATGGRPNPCLDPQIRPRDLTPPEKQTLIAFLQAPVTARGGTSRALATSALAYARLPSQRPLLSDSDWF